MDSKMSKEYDYPLTMKWLGDRGSTETLIVKFDGLKTGVVVKAAYGHSIGDIDKDWVAHNTEGYWEEIPRKPLKKFTMK